jgi:hypothetical protein
MSPLATGGAESSGDLGGLLLESLDEAFADLMGTAVRESFYGYFEKRYGISRAAIPERLEEFVSILAESLGVVGAGRIGRAVAKRLYTKLGVKFTVREDYTLLDYFREAKSLRDPKMKPTNRGGQT